MTVRDLYDAALIEINKLEAPSMLLEDYNYLINKAIQQKVNKSYNLYEINQQSTDDLLALRVTAKLKVQVTDDKIPNEKRNYFCNIPSDYWHILNCTVQFEESDNKNQCNKASNSNSSVARKLTSDLYPSIINNAYFKPSPKNPYYRVIKTGTSELDTTLNSLLNPCSNNDEKVILDLRCGDTDRYKPCYVYIDYLKIPDHVELSHQDLESEIDNTSVMEFSDYVCYEIINEFVKLLLENASDPRLQTNIPINQTIGNSLPSNQ